MRSISAKFVILIVLLLVATPLVAQHGSGEGHAQMGRMLDRLDVTAEQREQIHKLMAQRHESLGEVHQQMEQRRRAVAEAIHAEQFDEAAIREAVASAAQLEADIAVERALGLHDVLNLLTPEQREQARTMIEKHGGKARRSRRHQRDDRHAPRDLDN